MLKIKLIETVMSLSLISLRSFAIRIDQNSLVF